jgi:thiol-disulfide isomerase/thioredoxin
MAVLRPVGTMIVRGLGACLVLALAHSAAQAGAVAVGDPLPAVALSNWQGDPVRLVAPQAGVMVIDFWASWCQPCRAALPELNAIAQRYAADGLRVVAVNIDKTQEPADAFLQTYVPVPAMRLLRDPGGAALARFGAAGMPALYVVDEGAVVRLIESGFTAEKLRTVEAFVGKLLHPGDNP